MLSLGLKPPVKQRAGTIVSSNRTTRAIPSRLGQVAQVQLYTRKSLSSINSNMVVPFLQGLFYNSVADNN